MLLPISSFNDVDFAKGTLLLVDKPKGWTSFDVVNKIRHLIRRKYDLKKIKVGHSGTLDPMATGLLIVCTGAWTKELHHLTGLDKKYTAEITLGIETNTYDAEGTVVSEKEIPMLSLEPIKNIVQSFTGVIEQIPPAFSAIKKDGKPLYELARAGKEIKPEARKVIVHQIDVVDFENNSLKLDIHCGSGFYVRSLAHDIGAVIGCGAHLSALSRTMIGSYSLKDAFTMERINEMLSSD
jgi:tRNA pseudouridine55 synthase